MAMIAKPSLPLAVSLLLWITPGLAAERFCVAHRSGLLDCLYDDPDLCQREADRADGVCTGNPARLGPPPGRGAFCLAEGSAIICDREDGQACRREARRARGACVARWGK